MFKVFGRGRDGGYGVPFHLNLGDSVDFDLSLTLENLGKIRVPVKLRLEKNFEPGSSICNIFVDICRP